MLNRNLGFVKTGIKFEGCDVYIGVKGTMQGDRLAPLFRKFMNRMVRRSKIPTLLDVYSVMGSVRKHLCN